jgi:hypothetical protein
MIQDTLKERQGTHGSFEDNAAVTQLIKEVMHGAKNWRHLSAPQREGLDLIALKIGRMLTGDHTYLDNARDMVGYAQLIYDNMDALYGGDSM